MVGGVRSSRGPSNGKDTFLELHSAAPRGDHRAQPARSIHLSTFRSFVLFPPSHQSSSHPGRGICTQPAPDIGRTPREVTPIAAILECFSCGGSVEACERKELFSLCAERCRTHFYVDNGVFICLGYRDQSHQKKCNSSLSVRPEAVS